MKAMDATVEQYGFRPDVTDQGPEESTVGALAAVLRQSAGSRHAESDRGHTVFQGTNHGFFLGFLGFGATAAIMA